ncbi:MAG TPA: FG-GAP-like repeat-containing protein [Verrucomicrobiota bacterium]|nr:FG-GAP-like repeat-containing protein [Verrucomicrobiota bacterium]HRZ36159.1 FG-GAP-like repeat-containing protein [Candidatus Paceibacterota bacterium]
MNITKLVGIGIGTVLITSSGALAQDPKFTKQPTNITVSVGVSVRFVAVATSTNPPVTWQWWFKESALDTNANRSAATQILSLTNVILAQDGPYLAVATSAVGASATSQVATLTVDPTFTKITQGPLVNEGDMGGLAVAWGDYNDDGFLDVVITGGAFNPNAAYSSGLFTNRRDGSFALASPSPFTGPANAMCVNWADADNDGDLDFWLGVLETKGAPQYFTNCGNGKFNRFLPNATWIENGSDLRGLFQAWADYDGDGFVDLLVVPANTGSLSRPLSLLHNLGNGRFAVVTNSPLYEVKKLSIFASWIDFDNDGYPDLICGSESPCAFRNDGGSFVPWPEGDLPFVVGEPHTAYADTWGDIDNDGNLEVLVTGWSRTPQLWRNDYPHGWTRLEGPLYEALENVPTSTQGWGACWGDYDNDGDLDLFVATGHNHNEANRNHLFRNDGTAGFVEAFCGSPVIDLAKSWRCVWVDYDNDGFLDLHVLNAYSTTATQNDFLYRNNGNSNRWLEVKLVGLASNRSAIGAKVRVKAIIGGREVWQLRTISAQVSTQESVAHFGLATADRAEIIRIEWPSGIVQSLTNVPAGQILTVTEHQAEATTPPTLAASNSADGKVALSVNGQANLLYVFEASANLEQWTKIAVRTNLTGTLTFTPPSSSAPTEFYRVLIP